LKKTRKPLVISTTQVVAKSADNTTGTGAGAKEEASDGDTDKDKTPKTKETVGEKRTHGEAVRRSPRAKSE
jgi:hypothetical protein